MKQIDPPLLHLVIVWVEWKYVTAPPVGTSRSQRPYRRSDYAILVSLIREVRSAYHAEKSTYGKRACFRDCKERVMRAESQKSQWSVAARNFYSSVISTYVMWNYQGIPEAEKQLVYHLFKYRRYTTDDPTHA